MLTGLTVLVLAVWLSSFGPGAKQERAGGNTSHDLTVQVTASRTLIRLPPKSADLLPYECEPTEPEVKLSANSTSPHKDMMNFTWQVPVGRLRGKNRKVIWNLRGVEAGTYTATVEARDKHNHTASGSITVTVAVCPGWRPDPPPCPNIVVSCPAKADSNGSVTFVASVLGGPSKLSYKWSLSAGKIISGRGTSRLTVDVSGLSRDSVTATVWIGGLNRGCIKDASCKTEP